MYNYVAQQDDELSLKVGDVIRSIVKMSGGWWEGVLNGRKGVFPDNFVKVNNQTALYTHHHHRRRIVIVAVRCYASVAYVVMRCLSVRLSVHVSVMFVHSVKMNKHFFKIFSPSGSNTVLVLPHQTAQQYSDGNPPNGGVECRWGRQKSQF